MVRTAHRGRKVSPARARAINLVSREGQFSRIHPIWAGLTVAVIAGGPSLTQEQVDQVHGLPTIAVNDAYLLAPWADAIYFADSRWWEWHTKGLARPGLTADQVRQRFDEFQGARIKVEHPGDATAMLADPRVHLMRNNAHFSDGKAPEVRALSDRPDAVATGTASGYQAINIAYLAGATRILLLGFDARESAGRKHWFGDHPEPTAVSWLQGLRYQFQQLANALKVRGIECINCSPDSALECFPKMTVKEALESMVRDTSAAALSA
jgi:hypothetical protein